MELTWNDSVGSLGVLLVLAAYLLLHLQRLKAESLEYSLMNGLGAAFILVSLFKDFNFPAAVIETAWLAISIWGVVLYISRNNRCESTGKNLSPGFTMPIWRLFPHD